MSDIIATLKEYFGYDSFKAGQRELVEGALGGRDVLGITEEERIGRSNIPYIAITYPEAVQRMIVEHFTDGNNSGKYRSRLCLEREACK